MTYLVNIELAGEDRWEVAGPVMNKIRSWVVMHCRDMAKVKIEFKVVDHAYRCFAYFEDEDEMRAFRKRFGAKDGQ